MQPYIYHLQRSLYRQQMERQNNKIQIDEDAKKVIGIDFSKERSIFGIEKNGPKPREELRNKTFYF